MNQLQRIIDEKNIIEIADQLIALSYVIKLSSIELYRKKNDVHLLLYQINGLLAKFNLLIINCISNLKEDHLSILSKDLNERRKTPRQFTRDSIEFYLTSQLKPV
jgi:hypothetical protein